MSATIDETKAQAFVGKVLGDTSGLTVTVMAALGDRLGIWKGLAAAGRCSRRGVPRQAGTPTTPTC
jgi:hypothetical protein